MQQYNAQNYDSKVVVYPHIAVYRAANGGRGVKSTWKLLLFTLPPHKLLL